MPACPSCGEANPERARFCLSCGTPLSAAGAGERAHETRRRVTVLFTDVAGSTAIGEQLDPEALREVMQRYFDAMRVAIERHEGTVEKFIGDAVMAVFGIPQIHEDDALRAVRAAFDMQHALETLNRDIRDRWGVELAIRTGINTGEVVAGDATTGQALATGDVVNTAARLEQSAGAGEIFVGPATYQLVRHAVSAEKTPPLDLKGKAGTFVAWRLTSVDPTVGGQARHMDSPMVGRDRQLRILMDAAVRSREENAPQLVTILGLAGVGKSRLVHEFLGKVRDQATVIRGRCLSYGDAITYWPMAEALRGAAGIEADDTPDVALARLEALLESVPQAEVIARRVGSAIGLVSDEAGVGGGQETFWAIRRLLEAMARRRPLVAVFDDVQWGTPTFLDLLEHVIDWSRDAPILLVAIARPELLEARPTWGGGKLNATTLLLEPLDEAAVGEILGNLVGHVPLPADLAGKIEEAAEGNPFFVEELLAMLVDDGILAQDGDAYRVTRTPSDIAIPPSIELLLAARLDRLPEGERATLGRASVVGKRFGSSEVAQLSPETERETSIARLLALVRKELVRMEEGLDAEPDALDEEMRFRFRHQLVRDAAYEALPKHERARLHEVFADWMETALATRMEELHEVVGFHLEQACLYLRSIGGATDAAQTLAGRAVEHLAAGAEKARAIGDINAVRRLLERATSLLVRGDARRLRLLPRLAEAQSAIGMLEEAQAAVDEVLGSAADPATRAEALELVELQFQRGRTAADVAPMVEEALRIRRELGAPNGIAQALIARAGVEWFRGYLDTSTKTLEEALSLAQESGDELLEGIIRRHITPTAGLSRHGGRRDPTRNSELVEFGRAHGNFALELEGLQGMAFARAHDGDRAGALAILGEFLQRAEDLGVSIPLSRVNGTAVIAEWFGDLEVAIAGFREQASKYQEVGERGYLSSTAATIARLLLDAERVDEARDALRLAEDSAALDDIAAQVEIHADQARLRIRDGDAAGAEQLARRAVEEADETDYINLFMIARLALADVLRLTGRREDALRYIEEAAEAEDRRGNLAYAATVRRIPETW